jgi:hypothetical protein
VTTSRRATLEIVQAFFDFMLRIAGLVVGVSGEVAAALRALVADIEAAYAVEELDLT